MKPEKYMAIIRIDETNGIKIFATKEEAINFLIKVIGIKFHDDIILQEARKTLNDLKILQLEETQYYVQLI